MYIQMLIAQILLTISLVEAGIVPGPPTQRTQADLDAACAANCQVEVCRLADVTDCRQFIICQRSAQNLYHATLQPCAFGTYWAGVERKFTCDLPQNVNCSIDYCAGRLPGENYPHPGNCKTFWSCGAKGGPEAMCCQDTHYFDTTQRACVLDTIGVCLDKCPIKKDPCLRGDVTTEFHDDGNCRTFWDCGKNESNLVCCPEGQGYDALTKTCVNGCADPCTVEYLPECLLGPASRPNYFTLGNDEMPCPPGTMFDLTLCACGTHVKGSQDNSCNMELDVDFNYAGWNRTGSQRAIEINQVGLVNRGAIYQNRETYAFDGNLMFRVMFFRQAFPNLYLNLVFNPDDAALNERKIVLSNCLNRELGGPSLELFLSDGRINLILVTDAYVNDPLRPGQLTYASAGTSVAYTPNRWNRYRAVYNGNTVYVMNEVTGSPPVESTIDTKPLTGNIAVSAEGLDIGHCNVQLDPTIRGYTGAIAELQFTKCLRQEWIDSFNAAAATINTFPGASPTDPAPA